MIGAQHLDMRNIKWVQGRYMLRIKMCIRGADLFWKLTNQQNHRNPLEMRALPLR